MFPPFIARRSWSRLGLMFCLFVGTSLWAQSNQPPVFKPWVLREIDIAITNAIAESLLPGGVFWLERNGHSYHKAFGNRAVEPEREIMSEDTIFDAASLTKVVATTPAVMLLVERQKIRLSDSVQAYIPEFNSEGKEAITIRQLLTHTSGLRPDLDLQPPWHGYETAIRLACREKLQSKPGTRFRYSDINFLILGEVVRRLSGKALNQFTAEEVFRPLKMTNTFFLPATNLLRRVAPTERVDGNILRGLVHDPTARAMDGVAGHAGLFTTAADLARYARMLINTGELDHVRLFKPETVKLMTSVQSAPEVTERRGLGWDIDSGYSRPRGAMFPLGSYGHTGFTGTSIWIDAASRAFWILVSNRVHPDGKGNVLPLQRTLGTLSAEAINGFNFFDVADALPAKPNPASETKTNVVVNDEHVLNGIDVLAADGFQRVRGLRLGLVTNHTGQDRERNPTIDLLFHAPQVRLMALFSPEHGVRGALDEGIDHSKDEKTGLPTFSLYGKVPARQEGQTDEEFEAISWRARQPSVDQMRDLDAMVFDIQDVGCRFYTYISTMGGLLQAAHRDGKRVFILDRVNPITGTAVEGPIMTSRPSFVGFHPIPVRHGMTVGELAKMFNTELDIHADLTVIPVQGWHRQQWFDQTGLPWTNPSPNMRSLTEATLYPGVGLIELNPISVGRGTDTPFEVVGAPYVNDSEFARALNQEQIPGVRFVPVQFTPRSSTFATNLCGGVNIVLIDREKCPVVDIGIALARNLQRLYPKEFDLSKFNKLIGHGPTVDAIRAGRSLAEIKATWAAGLEVFEARRRSYLLYQ